MQASVPAHTSAAPLHHVDPSLPPSLPNCLCPCALQQVEGLQVEVCIGVRIPRQPQKSQEPQEGLFRLRLRLWQVCTRPLSQLLYLTCAHCRLAAAVLCVGSVTVPLPVHGNFAALLEGNAVQILNA